MKTVNIDWYTFQRKYLSTNRIFVIENDADWTLHTQDEIYYIKCIVEKYADQTENIMCVERYLNNAHKKKEISVIKKNKQSIYIKYV